MRLFSFFALLFSLLLIPQMVYGQFLSSSTITEPYISVSPDDFRTLEEYLFIVGRSDPKAIVTVTLTKPDERPVKFSVIADSSGEWTVAPREKVYLSAGYWQVRAKQQVGDQVSGESNPRVIRSVVNGVSIFGWNVRYVVIVSVVSLFLCILLLVFLYFRKKIHNLQKGLMEKHLKDTEDRFHQGFAEIRKDLMDQLKDLAAGSAGRSLTPDEVSKRDHILREIEEMEKNLEHDIGGIGRRY